MINAYDEDDEDFLDPDVRKKVDNLKYEIAKAEMEKLQRTPQINLSTRPNRDTVIDGKDFINLYKAFHKCNNLETEELLEKFCSMT